ncbi:MAG: hypothetical protein NVS4B12_00520 [Ktedonobacteraceae bacterium]
MELLVVTLAYTTLMKDVETYERIQLIQDTVRNTQGLVTSRFYRGRGATPCYAILTTWEDEGAWKQAQERYNPKQLLSSSAAELLVSPPEQWLFTYLWGYIRPSASPALASIHFSTVRTEQADIAQRAWIEGLRRHATQPTLAFAFLARGTQEQTISSPSFPEKSMLHAQGSTFLNLLSWSTDEDRENFYADANYKAVNRFLSSIGTVQILALEPL